MIRSSRNVICQLIDYGVDFARENGELLYTREGAHSRNRILYHEDITGKEITSTLLERVMEQKNVTIMTQTEMVDILARDNQCDGVILRTPEGELVPVFAQDVILGLRRYWRNLRTFNEFPSLNRRCIGTVLKTWLEVEHMD